MTQVPAIWRIQLLGDLRAERRGGGPPGVGEVVARFSTRKTAALLACLALSPGRFRPRETLVERFWPEGDPETARNSLSKALSSLRRQLEPPGVAAGAVIVASRTEVTLAAGGIETDVAAFEAALAARGPGRAAALARAVELYTGELCPEIDDDWAIAERSRLRAAFQRAAHELARERLSRGDAHGAEAVARRAVEQDPLREDARRDLMEALAAQGEAGLARREFELLAERLRLELGVGPSEATIALDRAIRDKAVPWVPAAAPPPGKSEPQEHPPQTQSQLPPGLPRLIGREADLAAVVKALSVESGRIVTILGPGGIGKTRLALEAARCVEEGRQRPVRVARLGDLADGALVAREICSALGVAPRGGQDPLGLAAETLGALGPALLLLDGVEPHVPGVAPLVTTLLERCPAAVLLCASRRKIGVAGERTIPLEPLETPGRGVTSPEALVSVPSVRLLLDRARDVRPDAQASGQNAAQLAEIARQLEGIPLALVLAGRRLAELGPARILARLSRRLDSLEDRRKDAPARHRTLRAAIDWSVDLLGETQRRFFARLSVFRAPFTVDAARDLCEEPLAQELVEGLVECSLINVVDKPGAERRHRFLDTVREDASDRVPKEARAALLARHRDYFGALAANGAASWAGPDQAAGLDRLAASHDDIRAAMQRALSDPGVDPKLALRMCWGLFQFWRVRGHSPEGLKLCMAALSRPGAEVPCRERAAALRTEGWLAYGSEDIPTARAAVDEVLAFERAGGGDTESHAAALNLAGGVAIAEKDLDAAARAFAEGIALARGRGDMRGASTLLTNLGIIQRTVGKVREGRKLLGEAADAQRATGSRRALADSLNNRGRMEVEMGDVEAGRASLAESQAIFEEFRDVRNSAFGLVRLAEVQFEWGEGQGALDRARAMALDGLERLRPSGGPNLVSLSAAFLAEIEVFRGDIPTARALCDESFALLRRSGEDPYHDGRARLVLAQVDLARGRMAEGRAGLLVAFDLIANAEPSHPQVARCMEILARLEVDAGAAGAARAATLLGLAASFRAAREAPVVMRDRPALRSVEERARKVLGDAAFDEAFARGRAATGWVAAAEGARLVFKDSVTP